jgi:hypothetical protein
MNIWGLFERGWVISGVLSMHMNHREYQEILVIHSDAIYQHRMMYKYMSDWLSKFDITARRYRDWLSEISDLPGTADKLNQSERLHKLPQYRKLQGREKADPADEGTTKKITRLTPGLIVFDLNYRQLTNGIKHELKLITQAEKGIQQKGGLAIVQFGEPGWFTRQFPHLITDILHLDTFPEGSLEFSSNDTGIHRKSERLSKIEDLSLFTFRQLMQVCFSRKVNRRSLMENGQTLGLYRFILNKLREITSACANTDQTGEPAKTIERYLAWCHSSLYYLSATDFNREVPEFNSWIYNEFDGVCGYTDLSRWGLQMTIAIFQALGERSLEPLLSICQSPCYSESPEKFSYSPFIAHSAAKAIDCIAGEKSFQHLTERIDHSHEEHDIYWLIRSLGGWVKDQAHPVQLQAGEYLISFAETRAHEPDIQTACVRALDEGGVGLAVEWLKSLYAKESIDEDLRRNVVLALMSLLGREASPLVIEYIQRASDFDRQVIASAAWRVDDDELLDQFLDKLTLDVDEDDLIANLIYSLVRAGNGMAYQLIFHGLDSTNPYLSEVAAGMAADCMIRCPERMVNKPILIDRLEELGRSARAPLNEYAALSLLRSGIDEYRSKGENLIEQYFRQEKFSTARMVILEAGLAYSDWPSDLHASWWLNHPLAEIRHVMVYILGYQRRTLLMDSSEYLQGDISRVSAYFDNPKTLEVAGRTISEAMELSSRRIVGEIPPVKVDRETYFFNM